MSAFEVLKLSPELLVSYEDMLADKECVLKCLVCHRGTTVNDFMEMAENGHTHEELVEILMTGTHPECFEIAFSGGEEYDST